MYNQPSHEQNKRKIAALMMILLLGLLLLLMGFTSCTSTKTARQSKATKKTVATKTNLESQKQTRTFDFSTIQRENYKIKYIPLDPLKEMKVNQNKNTGETTFKNAMPVFEKETTTKNTDVTTEKEEAKTSNTAKIIEATKTENTKQKYKLSVPWYAYIILAFFGFATMIGLFLIIQVSKRIKKLTT